MRFTPLVLSALTSTTVSAEYVRCGSKNPPAVLKTTIDLVARQGLAPPLRNLSTHIHVVVSTEENKANYPMSMLKEQVKVMNTAYNGSVYFNLNSISYTVNSSWADMYYGTQAERDMKRTLRKGTYRDLNLYFTESLGDLLGFCNFPVSNPTADDRLLDGCVNLAASMPGGTATNFNLGYTAVHEVGHWFGLFHTFADGACHGAGDYVADTPLQANATSGCPTQQDTCPGKPGLDSIHNYMDYSTDPCMYEFTPGQLHRMLAVYQRLRKGR